MNPRLPLTALLLGLVGLLGLLGGRDPAAASAASHRASPAGKHRAASVATAPPEPLRHELRISLDPASSSLTGRDLLRTAKSAVSFHLDPALELDALRCGERDLIRRLRPGSRERGRYELRVPRACRDETGVAELELEYHGSFDAGTSAGREPGGEASIEPGGEAAGEAEAEAVAGLGPGGAVLAGGSLFPDTGEPALHDLEVEVPAAWTVVSQGRVEPAAGAPTPKQAGNRVFVFRSESPTTGLGLVAGPYREHARRTGTVPLSVHLLDEDPQAAGHLLDAVESALAQLAESSGPYPESKLELVETRGAGLRSFPSVIAFDRRTLDRGPAAPLPDELMLELARAWWGRHVGVDAKGGDWSLGLRRFLVDQAAAAGEAEALERRRLVSQRYALDVPPERDQPPALFQAQDDAAWRAIGSGKVSLIFQLLRRQLGDAGFRAGLRELREARGGARASWNDLLAAFERASGEELAETFRQWVERPGLPRLSLADVTERDGTLSGAVTQEAPVWQLDVELEISLVDGTRRRERLALEGLETRFTFRPGGAVASVELDPDWSVPRRLVPAELPLSLARTLAAPSTGGWLIVGHPLPPASATPEQLALTERYGALAERIASRFGGEALPELSISESEYQGSSLLLLGGPEENTLTRRLREELVRSGVDASRPGFRAGSRRWLLGGDILLATIAHPERAGATVSFMVPNGAAGLEAAERLLEERWDSWVAWRGDGVRERGSHWPPQSSTRVELRALEAPREPAERLLATLRQFTRPELEGRPAGRPAGRRAAEELAESFAAIGLSPWDPRGFAQQQLVILRDLPAQPKLYRSEPGRPPEAYDLTPSPSWLPIPERFLEVGGMLAMDDPPSVDPILVALPEGLVLAGTVDRPRFTGLDLRGAGAVVIDEAPEPAARDVAAHARWTNERTAAYYRLLPLVRRHEGETLIVVRPGAQPPFFPALASYATLDAARDVELAAARELGGLEAVRRLVAERHARVPPPEHAVRLAFAGEALHAALRQTGGLAPGRKLWSGTSLDMRMRLQVERRFDRNVVGLALGSHRLRDGVIVVSASLDGAGLSIDGRILPGAVDDGAGIAVLVELARRFVEEPAALSVAFAACGAEEWGRQGSRNLVAGWPGHWPVLAAVNLAAVGQRGARLDVSGRERAPELVARLEALARERGIALGGDRAFLGRGPYTDYWAWAESGVPAIDLFQAEPRLLGGPEDRLEQVDLPGLAALTDVLEAQLRELARSPRRN